MSKEQIAKMAAEVEHVLNKAIFKLDDAHDVCGDREGWEATARIEAARRLVDDARIRTQALIHNLSKT